MMKITTTTNITVNIKVQLESTRNYATIYVQDKNANGRFVKSITFFLLGLHQFIKASMIKNLCKVDKKGIILKEQPSNITQFFKKREVIFKHSHILRDIN